MSGVVIRYFGPNDPTYLYRFFDEAGALLYVGIAFEPQKRWKEHATKAWWREVARKETLLYPMRRAALDAELKAIKTEAPKHNRQGVERPYVPQQTPRPRLEVADGRGRAFHHETDRLLVVFGAVDERSLKTAVPALRQWYPGLTLDELRLLLAAA